MEGGEHPPLIRDLLRPEAYPHPAHDLELHETHGAWVILAGEYAYKLKKPVDFGFFDFSTPELRAADAEAEVRLNRRLAPRVYLGVVDVVERDGQHFVGGEGVACERAVQMRRLPADHMLTALLQGDAVDAALVRRIARLLARFHRDVATGPGVDEHGSRATVEANWIENFDQVAPYVDVTIPARQLQTIRAYVESTLRDQAALFDRRVQEGQVRDGHGDVHAASICLLDRDIVVFDCIEFAARYRCADVAAEVAFLSMDLDHAGRPDLGWAFVDAYVRATGDQELLELLDFYKCYRAFVRGKVLSFRLAEPSLPAHERTEIVAQARGYFDLATVYAGGIPRPLLLITCGVPGSGKSTLAEALSERLGLLHLSTDLIRKQRAGLDPTDRAGDALYSAEITRQTYQAMRRRSGHWLHRGVSVVLDGTYANRRERGLARQLAQRTGVAFLLVHTTCDDETLRQRVERRAADPTRVSDADWAIAQRLQASFEPPDELPATEVLVDATGGGGAEIVIHCLLDTPR